jgi:lysophospholipase L1-like esterase
MRLFRYTVLLLLVEPALGRAGEPKPIAEGWDYTAAMRRVAEKFKGKPGVVLHLGDSITHANPYGQWARGGQGRTPRDLAVLKWMHAGMNNDLDGWYLAAVDRPGGRSDTAAGGMRADQFLAGGHNGLPSAAALLKKYQPQIVVLMLGTNDASAGRSLDAYRQDMAKALDLILDSGAVPILSTIPPHIGRGKLAESYNVALRELAKEKQTPLIDYEAEILKRRPKDWNGTLMNKGDVHPTAARDGTTASSAPTEQNLSNSGYLLRGWLSVQKIAEVKERVLDRK